MKDFCNYLLLFTSEAERPSSRVRFQCVMSQNHLLTSRPALLSVEIAALSIGKHSVSPA